MHVASETETRPGTRRGIPRVRSKFGDEFLQTHAGEGDEAGEGAGFDGAVHWHGDRPLRFAQDDVRAGLATFDETGPPGRARTASAPLTSRGNFI
jgi:hypothetical protein